MSTVTLNIGFTCYSCLYCYPYLEGATYEELRRSMSQNEVSSFEDVSTSPHDHHGQTHPVGGFVLKISVKLGHAEHRLREDCHEADRLYEPVKVQQQIHQY